MGVPPLLENLEGFSQILKEQSAKKRYLDVFTHIKILISLYIYCIKKKSGVHVVVDYTDTQFSNFAIEYLCKNEKVGVTVFACSHGAQVEYFKQNKIVKKS